MMGQREYGPALRAAALACGVFAAASAAAAEGEIYRIVGVEEGEAAHMRARPSSRARAVGYIPADARAILAGPCSGDWCQVRYNEKTGWVSRSLLKRETVEGGAEIPQHVNSSPAPDDSVRLSAGALPAARQPTVGQPPEPPGMEARPKTYVIAGAPSGTMLELREAPADGARVVGAVPHDAAGVEFLGENVTKWRRVRYGGVSGWILGRHLAEAGPPGQRFRVAGSSMLDSLAVREHPDPQAPSVGSIPNYASGIVAIGECGGAWCHIRYLGLVGWVERRFLEPLAERRG